MYICINQYIRTMANKKMMDFTVVENHQLHKLYSLLVLTPADGTKLPTIAPGQFVQVAIDDSPTTYLRRPISINFVDEEKNHLWLLVRKAGEGTSHLMAKSVGSTVNLLLPLGNGFSTPADKTQPVLLIGGGVGVAPLLYFGKKLKENGYKPEFLLGARNVSDLLQVDEFKKYGNVHLSTDDGSEGEHGVVTQHSVMATSNGYSRYYCCGPAPMMKAVARKAKENSVDCEVSLENMMACGVGACLCCVEKTVRGNVCVCTEGPVFDIEQLTW